MSNINSGLSAFFTLLFKNSTLCNKVFYGILAGLVAINAFYWMPGEPHFVYDLYPGFWAAFGLGVGVVMVFIMKRIIQPFIVRKEDYYGDI